VCVLFPKNVLVSIAEEASKKRYEGAQKGESVGLLVLFLPPHSPTLIILSRVKSEVIPDFFSEGECGDGEGEGGDGEHRRYRQRG
jgi:hypothetical protein